MSSSNDHLTSIKLTLPIELHNEIKIKAALEDEDVSSLIRREMAKYVQWNGPTRNMKGYTPGITETHQRLSKKT